MNGAKADDSVNTISRDRRSRKRNIGPNHHFFDVFRKKTNSENIRRRLAISI